MKLKFSFIIFLLVLFVPLEVLVLKYLPVSDTIYGYTRFIVEGVIYLLGGILLFRVVMSGKLPLGTSIDKTLLIFIGYALLVTIANRAPVLESFVGFRGLLRYIPLFYVLAFIKMEPNVTRQYFNLLLFLAFLQASVTIYQHYGGVSEFWYPRASDLEIGGKQAEFRLLLSGFAGGREQGAGIGTFGDSVPLALFMVISFILVISSLQIDLNLGKNKILLFNLLSIMALVTILFTYSRGSVLLAIFTLPLVLLIARKKKKLSMLLTVAAIVISPFIINMIMVSQGGSGYINPKFKYYNPVANVMTLFNSDYVDNTLNFSRGLVLTEIGTRLMELRSIIGYSPAQEFALEKAASGMFGSQVPIKNLPVINDVYWIAFVIYYGFAGLVIFLIILYHILRASLFVYRNSDDPYMKVFGLAMAAIVIVAIPYSLILRTFLFRSFGFYFWLIAGLVFAEWRRLKYERLLNVETVTAS